MSPKTPLPDDAFLVAGRWFREAADRYDRLLTERQDAAMRGRIAPITEEEIEAMAAMTTALWAMEQIKQATKEGTNHEYHTPRSADGGDRRVSGGRHDLQ